MGGLSGSYDEINIPADITATVLLGYFHARGVESGFQGDVYFVIRGGQFTARFKKSLVSVASEIIHRQVFHSESRRTVAIVSLMSSLRRISVLP